MGVVGRHGADKRHSETVEVLHVLAGGSDGLRGDFKMGTLNPGAIHLEVDPIGYLSRVSLSREEMSD